MRNMFRWKVVRIRLDILLINNNRSWESKLRSTTTTDERSYFTLDRNATFLYRTAASRQLLMTANYFAEDAAILSIWFWQEPPNTQNVRQSMNQRRFTQFSCLFRTLTLPIRWPTFGQAQCLSGMSIDLILFGGQIGFSSISFADLWFVFELCVLFLRFRSYIFF